jgi:hypothetical protein
MVRKVTCVNQGDLLWKEPEFMDQVPKSRATGVRAPVVAMKLRNGSGAKGAQEGGDVKT